MEAKAEIREFLTSRRSNITPDQVGLPVYGDNRRVPGLRREEVALLAGVSADYYTRLERGNVNGVSDSVLEALVRALQLDDAERAHLFDLVRSVRPLTSARRRHSSRRVRPGVHRLLDAMSGVPAYVRSGRGDILASNQLCRALYAPMFDTTRGPVNTARFTFLDPRAPDFFVEWDQVANLVVAALRSEAGRDPYDRALTDLVGELSTQSQDFRTRWAAHNVRFHDTGIKRFRHPVVGELTLSYEVMQLSADQGLTIAAYTAEPGTKSHEALNLLGSWAATLQQEDPQTATDVAESP